MCGWNNEYPGDGSSYTSVTEGEDMKACLFSEGQLIFSGSGLLQSPEITNTPLRVMIMYVSVADAISQSLLPRKTVSIPMMPLLSVAEY